MGKNCPKHHNSLVSTELVSGKFKIKCLETQRICSKLLEDYHIKFEQSLKEEEALRNSISNELDEAKICGCCGGGISIHDSLHPNFAVSCIEGECGEAFESYVELKAYIKRKYKTSESSLNVK